MCVRWVVPSITTAVGLLLPDKPSYASSRPLAFHPHPIIIGNGFILFITSLVDSVLPRSFYLNDVLIASDLVPSLFIISLPITLVLWSLTTLVYL
jgi:hypothetical protein